MNFFLLCLHITTICTLTLLALRYGIAVMIPWLCLLAVAMNLFVLKQITLFGLSVTASDALAVGYLLGLNLIQEFFGQTLARKVIFITLFICSGFVLLSQIHLLYTPNTFDYTQVHFFALFHTMPRIIFASLVSFLIVQLFDLLFFSFLRKQMSGKYFPLRAAFSLFVSEILDTFLFSFLGLYGQVASIASIIFLSLIVKTIVICLSVPFVTLARKVGHVQV